MIENINENILKYKVGGLLYIPAITKDIENKIEKNEYKNLTSIAFCLEDSIQDDCLDKAEIQLKDTLVSIKNKNIDKENLPLLFIRIRNPKHLEKVHNLIKDELDILTGYIAPKFDLSNMKEYIELIEKINRKCKNKIYLMPILETKMIASVETRVKSLLTIKNCLDTIKEYILNIRVGGNDFSNLYGLRRSISQNIYEIGIIRDILIDIINIFSMDYVVSSVVWEYFQNNNNNLWELGLKKELELDFLNGFIGKTAIHPTQLPIIFESLKVSKEDYEDALKIINWKPLEYGVEKSAEGNRMNEVKCHIKWAEKIYILSKIYGVK